jgi:hypothetical protein
MIKRLKYHNIKRYAGVEVKLHILFALEFHGDEEPSLLLCIHI